MRIKYVALVVIGDKKATKSDIKHFIFKSSYQKYIRRYKEKVLSPPIVITQTDRKLSISSYEELLAMEWLRD